MRHTKFASITANITADTPSEEKAIAELVQSLTDQDILISIEIVNPKLFDAIPEENSDQTSLFTDDEPEADDESDSEEYGVTEINLP